jgi:hypothetical protein
LLLFPLLLFPLLLATLFLFPLLLATLLLFPPLHWSLLLLYRSVLELPGLLLPGVRTTAGFLGTLLGTIRYLLFVWSEKR